MELELEEDTVEDSSTNPQGNDGPVGRAGGEDPVPGNPWKCPVGNKPSTWMIIIKEERSPPEGPLKVSDGLVGGAVEIRPFTREMKDTMDATVEESKRGNLDHQEDHLQVAD